MKEDELYIQRCIQLAKNGRSSVSPNPMVGAVVVCDGKIIGEGYHVRYGEPHAEVNAIGSVKDESLLARSTIYVSLEPCSHYGKTPPCTDLIIDKQIPRIVIGCQDPFVEVAGRGISKLREAGREVVVGVLEEECRNLVARFIVANTLQRPYVVLKWAESSDGFIDLCRTGGSAVRLSTSHTAMLVHKKRAEIDAIMVGTNTALLDNPSLNVRNWYGDNPIRVLLDKELRVSTSSHLLDGAVSTLVYTCREKANSPQVEYVTLDDTRPLLAQIMEDMSRRRIQSVLVEGGSALLQSFITLSLWDEAYVEKSRKLLFSGVKAPIIDIAHPYEIEKHFGVYFRHYINRRY